MELRCCGNLHFIQAIKGGLVTKVPNVARGQPKLKFKNLTDAYEDLSPHNDGMVERSCLGEIEESTEQSKPDASVCNDENDDDQRIVNLDYDDFDSFTLSQFKESCKTRKRKRAQGLNSSKKNIKVEVSSFQEDYREEKMAIDDSDFMETLSCLKSKLSKNMKEKKKKLLNEPISTYTKENMVVVKSEEILYSQEFPPCSEEVQNGQDFSPSCYEIQNSQEFPPSREEIQDSQEFPPSSDKIQDSQEFPPSSEEIYDSQVFPTTSQDIKSDQEIQCFSGHSVALVEVKSEVPETDYFGGPDDYSIIEFKEAEIVYEWNLESQLNDWQKHLDFIPLRMVKPCGMDITISDFQLSNGRSPGMLPIEFHSEECITHTDHHYISPQVISIDDYNNSDIDDNQPNAGTQTAVSLPDVATQREPDCIGVEFKDDNNSFGVCTNDEFTTDAGDQVEASPTIEHGLNPDGCLFRCSDDPPKYEENQSFASVNNDEKRYVNEATDELTSCDECNASSKLHHPERLLSTRKTISPSSQEKLCKAVESVDLNHKSNLKCKGKVYFSKQTGKMNGTAEELDDITGARFTDVPNKISVIPRTKRVSHSKGISKNPHSSRQATRLGCNTVQSCSKSAIAFTQQQMNDAECLATKLTKELKSLKDIMDDMLRSEFCLNTSLRHKVNEARMAVKNATRAEAAAKRCLAFMSRDCNRFCKIMKLADDNGPPPQDLVVRKEKERKKIAFADEAGGRLCQVKFYEDDGITLSESN